LDSGSEKLNARIKLYFKSSKTQFVEFFNMFDEQQKGYEPFAKLITNVMATA
jgi:hypothetical protein